MNELALFAGIGGGILGGQILGWHTVCAVELDVYCQKILFTRQRDGYLPRFPIWDDVRTFNGRPWRGRIDIITGGFPCQDISSAGRGAGIDGERSGLWREYARIVGEVRPKEVFIENSPLLRTRGLVRVLKDLAGMGYDAKWCVLGADDVGAPHYRKRMWILAYDQSHSPVGDDGPQPEPGRAIDVARSIVGENSGEQRHRAPSGDAPDADGQVVRVQQRRGGGENGESSAEPRFADWWPVDLIARVDDGRSNWMERIRATGNAQVPRVAALAYATLKGIDL